MWIISSALSNAHLLLALAAFFWVMAHLAYGPAE